MSIPAKILTTFKPTSLTIQAITVESAILLRRLNLYNSIDPRFNSHPIRTPAENYEKAWDLEQDNIGWHRDGHNGYRPDRILLWSNIYPTDIIDFYHSPFPVKSGDLVLLNHLKSWHRLPPLLREWENCKNRWSLRIWLRD